MRPRGYILLVGMVLLTVIMAAVLLLARAATSRLQARRVETQRNIALAGAESALEQARAELTRGTLTPGASMNIAGLNVSCASTLNGDAVALDTLVPLEEKSAKPGAKIPHPAVRVRWTLTKDSTTVAGGQSQQPQQPQQPHWSVSEWHAQNETVR